MKPRGILERAPRTVIPRWRPFPIALHREPQLSSVRRANIVDLDHVAANVEYDRAVSDFRKAQTTWFAGDLLADAIGRRDDDVAHEVASFIMQNRQEASPTLVEFARSFEGEGRGAEAEPRDVGAETRAAVPRLRRQIDVYPSSAIAWADLAYYFTLAGKEKAADRATRIALGLAPTNRFVLRSAARYFGHRDQHDRAHDVLRLSEATPHDPWLLAAEIATASAAHRRSRWIQEGRTMVKNFSYDRLHISELASAIGTAEMEAAAPRRQVRTMFSASLERPTENSVAQADWAARNGEGIEAPNLFGADDANEARAWSSFVAGEYDKALEFAQRWFDDQPFSVRPAQLISWIDSSLRDDHNAAIEVLKRAVIANQRDPVILNNLAFAYGSLNETGLARKYNDRGRAAAHTESEKLFATATQALIAFREGRFDMGRSLYMNVIERAAQGDGVDDRIEAMAWVSLAREECIARTPFAINAVASAADAVHRCSSHDASALFMHLEPVFSQAGGSLTRNCVGEVRIR